MRLLATQFRTDKKIELWGDVNIICPNCKTKKTINVPERLIAESDSLYRPLIPSGRVCEHSFIAFIDKNFKVRGYQKIDGSIDEFAGIVKKIEIKAKDLDVFGIKMNISPEMIINSILSTFNKRRVLFLIENDTKYLANNLDEFFNFIFQGSFICDILIETKENYKKNKAKYVNYIVLAKNKVLGRYRKSYNIMDMDTEIVRNFYRNADSISSLKNLRDKLREFYALSYKIKEYYKNYKKQGENNPLHPKKVIRFLEDTHFLKIKKSYFYFLISVVKSYFDVDILFIQDILSDKLSEM